MTAILRDIRWSKVRLLDSVRVSTPPESFQYERIGDIPSNIDLPYNVTGNLGHPDELKSLCVASWALPWYVSIIEMLERTRNVETLVLTGDLLMTAPASNVKTLVLAEDTQLHLKAFPALVTLISKASI
jgi:hypothetical protein